MDVAIRPARPEDAAALSDLAVRSKGHWGYDAEFLERARPELAVSADELERMLAGVAVDGEGAPLGFYAVDLGPEPPELLALFVDPAAIGTGLGARLFAAAAQAAREAGLATLVIESDPNAEGFYRSRGARRLGERVSRTTGRALPLLELDLR